MILDTLSLWSRYASLNPRFTKAFAFLERVTADVAVGRHEIEGDAVYALAQAYRTRPAEALQFEAHRRYIDIQYVVRGREAIHWAPLMALGQATLPHDTAKDVALYAAPVEPLPVLVGAGQFAILFPDDAHAPCHVWGEPEDVVKVVVKVEI